jgi:hypothetical protein
VLADHLQATPDPSGDQVLEDDVEGNALKLAVRRKA